jgi:hypothetical protein
MSYIYLLEQGEESSADTYWDIPVSVRSSWSHTAAGCSSSGRGMEFCPDSQSGTMSGLSTAGRGGERSMWCAGDSPARISQSQAVGWVSMESGADSGPRWPESLAKWDPDTCSWKTHQLSLFGGLEPFSGPWPQWGIMQDGECWGLGIVEDQWNASGFGLPAPTKSMGERGWGLSNIKPRYSAKLEANARIFGYKPHPSVLEWSMGWIPTWTRLAPLEMDKFQQWLRSHGEC